MRYRSTRKSVYSAKYHVTWCPKYRQRVIGGRVEAWLKQIIDEVVTECGGDVIECETMPDHVHLLLELPPTVPLSALMQKPKGRSSRRLWAEFPQLRRLPALWSPSWFVSTAGGAPLDVVRRYARAALTSTELSVTALRRSAGPTISSTKDWRAGFSKALLRPSRSASKSTCLSLIHI